jgi:Flp pilus assembly protein TadB
MATLLALAGGALVNALAFSGTNFMFSKLSDHGESERKRHDKAVEDLQKSEAEWRKKRQQRIDFINQELRRRNEAQKYISDMNEGNKLYYLATKQRLPELPPRPVFSDFYVPSQQQKDGELLFIAGGLGLVAYALYHF